MYSAGYGECLLDPPVKDHLGHSNFSKIIAGVEFDENRQCQLVFGNGSQICPYMVIKPKSTYLYTLQYIRIKEKST